MKNVISYVENVIGIGMGWIIGCVVLTLIEYKELAAFPKMFKETFHVINIVLFLLFAFVINFIFRRVWTKKEQ